MKSCSRGRSTSDNAAQKTALRGLQSLILALGTVREIKFLGEIFKKSPSSPKIENCAQTSCVSGYCTHTHTHTTRLTTLRPSASSYSVTRQWINKSSNHLQMHLITFIKYTQKDKNLKLSLGWNKQRAVKACGGVEVKLHSFLMSAPGGRKLSASLPLLRCCYCQRLSGLWKQCNRCSHYQESNPEVPVFDPIE